MDALLKLFDSYSRKARLYRALLTLAPLVCTILLLQDGLLGSQASESIVVLVVAFGGTFLLANLARSRGKILEGRLTTKWGGWPTTILPRHSDTTIDPYTKARYHQALTSLTKVDLTEKGQEVVNRLDCDHRYRAATTKLIELRRDEKYDMLHQENANYGFRRNLLGLKTAATIILLISMLVVVALWLPGVDTTSSQALRVDVSARWHLYAAFALNLGVGIIWLIFVTESFVRQAGNEYALSLLRTLDIPPP